MSDAALIFNGWQINFRNRNLFSDIFNHGSKVFAAQTPAFF